MLATAKTARASGPPTLQPREILRRVTQGTRSALRGSPRRPLRFGCGRRGSTGEYETVEGCAVDSRIDHESGRARGLPDLRHGLFVTFLAGICGRGRDLRAFISAEPLRA